MSIKNSDLYKKHEEIIKLKKETYDKITKRCINTIKLTANTGELICTFEIPYFIFGTSYPLINIEYCANYVINKITNENSSIRMYFIKPNIILADWRRIEDADKYKNLIIDPNVFLDSETESVDINATINRSTKKSSNKSSSNKSTSKLSRSTKSTSNSSSASRSRSLANGPSNKSTTKSYR